MAEIAASRKEATLHLNPQVLDFKRVGDQRLPTYPFSDRNAPDKLVNNVFFMGNSMVNATKVEEPRVPEVAQIPELLADSRLDCNINGVPWSKMDIHLKIYCITID